MTVPLPPSDDREDEFHDRSEDQPEARLRAASPDRRTGDGPQDLLRETDERTARRAADHEIDDSQPESRLEASPVQRRTARSAEDLLKDPQPDPGTTDRHLAP